MKPSLIQELDPNSNKIDPETGLPTTNQNGIIEVFREGYEPFQRFILDDKTNIIKDNNVISGTGGLLLN